MATIGLTKTIPRDYDTVVATLPDVLKSEGFGVLTEVDMQSTLKAKLGVEFQRYKILGACNPPLAHQALTANLAAGLMMPCNVIVYETTGGTIVTAIDPLQTFAADEPSLRPVAEAVRGKLERVIEKL